MPRKAKSKQVQSLPDLDLTALLSGALKKAGLTGKVMSAEEALERIHNGQGRAVACDAFGLHRRFSDELQELMLKYQRTDNTFIAMLGFIQYPCPKNKDNWHQEPIFTFNTAKMSPEATKEAARHVLSTLETVMDESAREVEMGLGKYVPGTEVKRRAKKSGHSGVEVPAPFMQPPSGGKN